MVFQSTAAAGLLLALGASAQSTISSGQGFGTYYYDIKQVDACGTSFKYQNEGGLMCSPETLLSLNHMDTNNIVAMNNSQLGADMSKYCGKKVVVSVNGQKSDRQLFIGDGCDRCATGSSSSDTWNAVGAPGLDFSYTVLNELSGGSACNDGHITISWQILDEQVYNFGRSSSGFVSLPGPSSSGGVAEKSPAQAKAQAASLTAVATSVGPAKGTGSCMICANNAWRCNGDVLEQCLSSSWTPRVTCAAGSTCRGGSHPYCT